jgi:signal transduction histidine kinase
MAADGPPRRVRSRLASLRVRVVLTATAVVAVALIIGALSLLAVLRAGLLRSLSGSGPERAAEVAALASRGSLPDPLPDLDAARLTLVQVVDPTGHVVAASRQLQGQPAVVAPAARRHQVLDDLPALGGGPWLVEPTPATIANRPVTVIVITSVAEFSRSAELLRGLMLVIVPSLITLVGVVVWIVVGRSLRPVEQMRVQVAEITAHRLDRRVPIPDTKDEVGRLAHTLNDMLDRLEQSSNQQRQFVADASHELRTPVANIRAAVEVATAHPEATDWSTVAADVLRQDVRMERLVSDLLLLARSDTSSIPLRLETFDLRELVRSECNREVPTGRELEHSVPRTPVIITADHDQLGRIITNLVDNALRHATSRVTLALTTEPAWVEISVNDDGPGIERQDRERIFHRFVRLDSHRASSHGGAGLGLPIVRQLAEAHGGSVHVAESAHGSSFVVRLPIAPSSASTT